MKARGLFLQYAYMFAGRRFDIEIGLYYNRARYYNPYTGRFLQADPIGYGDGMNMYAYCGNNPINLVDPSGLIAIAFYDGSDEGEGVFTVDGDDFKEMADDFYVNFDIMECYDLGMKPTEYIIWILENWDDMGGLLPITDVFIYDHAYYDTASSGHWGSIEIGDETLAMQGVELREFCEGLRDNTDYETFIHFRGCDIANENARGQRPMITRLAELTDRVVTAVDGKVRMTLLTDILGGILGPDYTFDRGLYMAVPSDGVVIGLFPVWKNELIPVFPSGYYNPWGPQPY